MSQDPVGGFFFRSELSRDGRCVSGFMARAFQKIRDILKALGMDDD
jgi:hypothetical protein